MQRLFGYTYIKGNIIRKYHSFLEEVVFLFNTPQSIASLHMLKSKQPHQKKHIHNYQPTQSNLIIN